MQDHSIFTPELISQIRAAGEPDLIQPVRVGDTHKENELVFFIKPELLEVEDDALILNSLRLIETRFDEFDVEISGAMVVPGDSLEEFGIMNRHYGFINQLSRFASTMLDNEDYRRTLLTQLGLPADAALSLLGGHEFLTHFQSDLDTLSSIWFAQEAHKLRSGFYFIRAEYQGEPFILVNGFHPSQLAHFTRSDHRILLLLLHTNTDWYDLKFDLVGDTFPERAASTSIRGMLFADPQHYGQKEVVINTNGVHLSAGPFESAFEVVNFFGSLLNLDPHRTPPLAIKRVVESGWTDDEALSLLENPAVEGTDLFSATENLNTQEAVDFVLHHFNN